MPVEINDFYLPNAPSPCLIVQTDLRGDAFLIHCTLVPCVCGIRPSGNAVFVINGNIVLKCRTLFRAAEVCAILIVTRSRGRSGGGFETESGSILLAETSPALPPRAQHNDLLTFSLCLATLGFKCSKQRLILWVCHLERKFDMQSDRR